MTADENDDLLFDHASAAEVADALRESSPAAADVVRDHVEYFDEVLPTVLLAEIGRWYRSTVSTKDTDDGRAAALAVQAASDLFEAGNQSMRDIVATGLLESLPQPHEEDREVVDRLPTALREELRRMEE